jgi:hypothetical protein
MAYKTFLMQSKPSLSSFKKLTPTPTNSFVNTQHPDLCILQSMPTFKNLCRIQQKSIKTNFILGYKQNAKNTPE